MCANFIETMVSNELCVLNQTKAVRHVGPWLCWKDILQIILIVLMLC